MSTFTTRDGTAVFYKDWGAGQPMLSANPSETKPANLLAVFVVDTNETELTILFGTEVQRYVILAEIEHAEARQPAQQRFDVSVLRRELGVQ